MPLAAPNPLTELFSQSYCLRVGIRDVAKGPVKTGMVQEVKVLRRVRASNPLWPQAMRRRPAMGGWGHCRKAGILDFGGGKWQEFPTFID
jgi:hypothetical protein